MSVVRSLLSRIAFAVLLVGGVGMLFSMFLGTADVVGTQFLDQPVPGALELTESTMVLIVFGALAYAQIRKSHIRVELLYTRMGPRAQVAMDIIAHLAALLFFGLLLWQAILESQFSWQIGEATVGLVRFPLYPARWILAAGTALMMAQLLLDLLLDIRRLMGLEPFQAHREGPEIPDTSHL